MPVPTVSAPQRHYLSTRDVEEAHDLLRTRYADHEPKLSGSRERFVFESTAVQTDHFGLERMTHSMATEAATEPLHALIIVRPGGGRFRIQSPYAEIRPVVGESVLMDPGTRGFVEWDSVKLGIVRLELEPTLQHAAGLSGLSPSEVYFSLGRPLSHAHARQWQADVRHVSDVLDVPEVAASPLIRGEAYRLLATSLVHTFPNSALDALRDPLRAEPGRTDPPVVRRAVEYIDSHAGDDIGPAEIADAAGVSPRALQHAFRRHRDTSPLEYLREVRMEGAHRDLRAGDPTRGDTVADVAHRWGFVHLGHFAARYRRRFGATPSETLRH